MVGCAKHSIVRTRQRPVTCQHNVALNECHRSAYTKVHTYVTMVHRALDAYVMMSVYEIGQVITSTTLLLAFFNILYDYYNAVNEYVRNYLNTCFYCC